MSVNLSGRQIAQADLVDVVANVLEQTRLPAANLVLEITESVLMHDAEAAITVLRGLKGLGVRLSIDDFGTGYSSLSYLKKFPVDVLKIDRSFVDGLGIEGEDTAIVRATINLAQSLGLETVGEGAETPTQVRALTDLGCDKAQGYLFCRPQSAAAVPPFLPIPPIPPVPAVSSTASREASGLPTPKPARGGRWGWRCCVGVSSPFLDSIVGLAPGERVIYRLRSNKRWSEVGPPPWLARARQRGGSDLAERGDLAPGRRRAAGAAGRGAVFRQHRARRSPRPPLRPSPRRAAGPAGHRAHRTGRGQRLRPVADPING